MKNLLFVLSVILFASCSQSKFNDGQYEFSSNNGVITVSHNEEAYYIEPYRSDIVKATFVTDKTQKVEENPYFVILDKDQSLEYQVVELEDKLQIKTEEVIVEVTKSPFVVNFYDNDSNPILVSSKTPNNEDGQKTMYFKSPSDEAFYGMGQKSISVDRRGHAFHTRNQHIGGYTKEYGTMQVNIPYIYSSKNYGILFDNTYTGYFDLAESNSQEWSYRTDGGDYTFYFSKEDGLQELQNAYYDLTGYPTLPPKWTLGLMQSRCGYHNEEHVFRVVKKFDELGLPLDAIILDAFWFGGYGDDYPQLMGNFTWLKSNFPDPKGYMSKLKAKGIKTMTINEPQINVNSENYEFLMNKDWMMKVDGKPYTQNSFWAGAAALLDLSNPDAQAWLWQKQKANVELGLDAFWVDLTEPDVSTPEGLFYGGEEPKIHNIYSYLFAKTLSEGFKKEYPNKRLFNITRAGTAGMQRFGAVHWSGDASKTFDALKANIPMLVGCAMSGMPHYSSDIGGFTNAYDTISVPWNEYKGGPGVTTPELYTRWFQFGVFSPSLRPHSGEGQDCEPFAFDKQTLDITSDYLRLRYELIPYLYTYAHKTATEGEQLIKPLFMCFDDKEAVGRDFDYMFGDMLVAPIYEAGQTKREVYLPRLENGLKWVDFWNNKEYEGGKIYTVDAPIDKIPVFVKGGSVLVMGKCKRYVDEFPDESLCIKVYPGNNAEFTLYEDDGTTMGYTRGEFAETQIKTTNASNKLTISIERPEGKYDGMVEERTWKVKLYQTDNVSKVLVDGTPAKFSTNKKDGCVEVEVIQKTGETVNIEVNC